MKAGGALCGPPLSPPQLGVNISDLYLLIGVRQIEAQDVQAISDSFPVLEADTEITQNLDQDSFRQR